MAKNTEQTVGILTFAWVDLPNDEWAYAIVTNYEGSQDYGDVVCAFVDGFEPGDEAVGLMLAALNKA